MKRLRDVNDFVHHRIYRSINEFLSFPLQSGVHSLSHGQENIDLLIVDRRSPVTLVMFHSALTPRTPTTPVFQGQTLSNRLGSNLVAISDPSLERGDIDLAWYLGNRGTGPLRPILTPLIQHSLLSLETKRTVFMGASGGGYAAINFAQDFADTIVLAINPRLDMEARPVADITTYLAVCHNALSATPQRRIRDEFVNSRLVDNLTHVPLPFELLLFQNTGDKVYKDHQAAPFISALADDPRMYTRLEYTADGHRPIPKPLINEILRALFDSSVSTKTAISNAGFKQARDATI